MPPESPVEVRLSEKGLEPANGPRLTGGFGDTKKVAVLALLAVVAAGVIAYQFLGGSGPKQASAKPVGGPKAGGAPPVSTVKAAVEKARQEADPKAGTSTLSVDRVEELVREFDTYIQRRQVPLADLKTNPFAVGEVVANAAAAKGPTPAEKAAADAEARRRKILQEAARLKLGAVLIAGDQRAAVIEGKLYHVGDEVAGLRLAGIEADHVVLTYENETVRLTLRSTGKNR